MNKYFIKEQIKYIDSLSKLELQNLYLSYSRLVKRSDIIMCYLEMRLEEMIK